MRRKYIVKAKSVWSKRKRELLNHALQYAFWELNLYKLDVHIIFRLVGTQYAPGSCTNAGNSRYIVHIDGYQDEHDIVETLFHELQHVVQYALGYLQDEEEDRVYWLGSWYTGDFQDTDSLEYWNAPWEVEAREVAMYTQKNYYQS